MLNQAGIDFFAQMKESKKGLDSEFERQVVGQREEMLEDANIVHH